MEEESWRSWFSDLEAAAGDCSLIMEGGEYEELNKFKSSNSYFFSDSNYKEEENMMNDFTSTMVDDHERSLTRLHHAHMEMMGKNSNISISNSAYRNSSISTHNVTQLDTIYGFKAFKNNILIKDNKLPPSPSSKQLDTKDHIIAERMRRQKITQHFIALSALIPGLKKADKTSVLEETIKYMKQLQERLKVLEEETKRKSLEESEDGMKWNNNNERGILREAEVEARVWEKDVLIRIQCEKPRKGVMMKMINREIEKLHLSLINTTVMPFGTSIMDITIIAQMEDEFNLSAKDLAVKLKVAILQEM